MCLMRVVLVYVDYVLNKKRNEIEIYKLMEVDYVLNKKRNEMRGSLCAMSLFSCSKYTSSQSQCS